MDKQLSGKAMEKFPDYKTVSVSMKRNGNANETNGDNPCNSLNHGRQIAL